MVSLYDYLGRAAGAELGAKVNTYATIRKQKYATRDVNNSAYAGKVFLYSEEFLDEYFKVDRIFNQ